MLCKLGIQFRFLYPLNCNDGTDCVPEEKGETFVRVWFSKPEIESKLWFNDVGDAACGDTLQLETAVANVPNAK